MSTNGVIKIIQPFPAFRNTIYLYRHFDADNNSIKNDVQKAFLQEHPQLKNKINYVKERSGKVASLITYQNPFEYEFMPKDYPSFSYFYKLILKSENKWILYTYNYKYKFIEKHIFIN